MKQYLFWLLPVIMISFQAVYTFASMNQIRMEEVIESFRSVWFFENRLVWNGSYTSIGWHALVSLVYQLTGFHFFSVKYLKLAIELVSFFALAAVLKKYLGFRAWLPLLLIAISPTFLYFNLLQMSHGVDIGIFFICLYIVDGLDFSKHKESIFKQVFLWILAMCGWLIYGGFIYYLVIIGLIYLYKLFIQKKQIGTSFKIKNLAISSLAFLLPLVLFFSFIENRELLIKDPLSGKGLFRSYGNIEFSRELLTDNYYRIYQDLFVRGYSYYFEPEYVEFSDFYPILSIIVVVFGTALIYKQQKDKRVLIIFMISLFVLSLILVGIAGPKTLGGVRRGTVLLILFYGFYSLVWDYLVRSVREIGGMREIRGVREVCLLFLLFLPLHHLLVYPANLENLSQKSRYREYWWFNSDTPPDKIIADLVMQSQKTDVVLPCLGEDLENGYCKGLSLIYPQIELSCRNNHLKCNNIYTFDPRLQDPVKLGIEYWGKQTHVEP